MLVLAIAAATLLAAPPDAGPDAAPDAPTSSAGFADTFPPPFPQEELTLSSSLQEALRQNLTLKTNAIDVEISEARVLAALGAYDVFITAGFTGSVAETPQRGSQFTISQGSRSFGANVGFNRALETGGNISVTANFNRTITDQAINFFDPNSGATALTSYAVVPSLTLSHPLLRGAGLRVNRADINRAKIATSQSQAVQLQTAQDTVRDVISAYWDVLFAQRDLDNKRKSTELARAQLDRTNALVAAGRLSPVDAKAVEQGLATRQSDVLQAENALLDASLTLRTLMGQEFSRRDVLGVAPATDPLVKPRTINVRDEMARALRSNPQVRQLELALASRRIDELVAANAKLPQLDASVTFTPQGRSVDQLPDQASGNPGSRGSWGEAFRNIFSDDIGNQGLLADFTLTGTLSLTWDVQNRGPKGNHQAALLEIKKAEVNLHNTRQQIAASVIRSAYSVRTAGKVIEVADISEELAQENLAAEQARFEVGRSTNFDVLQRLDELDTAQSQALNARIGYLKALAQLQALNGEILPAYGLDLS